MLPFLILGNNPEEKPLELIDAFATNVTEFSSYQEIKLLFSKTVYPSSINHIDIVNNRNEHFNVYVSCVIRYNNSFIRCHGYFDKIRADKYLITRVENSDSFNNYTYPSRNIYIQIQERKDWELKLMNIEGKVTKGFSPLNLIFNKQVFGRNISNFKLYNEKNLYDLWVPPVKQSNKLAVSVDFNFAYIPEGAYHLSMIYSGHEYKFSNKFINITKNKYPHHKRDLTDTIYRLIDGKRKIKS